MTPREVLVELLGRVGAADGNSVFVSEAELCQWPAPGVSAMRSQGLIAKASPDGSAVCPGCERECVMPIHVLTKSGGRQALFVVCDKRSDTNRVEIDGHQIALWQSNARFVARFVAACQGVRLSEQATGNPKLWHIGVARGRKRSQMLCLRADGVLDLVAGSGALPLAELVVFSNDHFALDSQVVQQLVDASTTADERHTPSIARREASKLDTQAMYGEWQKAYRDLVRKHPYKSEVWYSQHIAKTPIGQGRDANTIKKHMKA